MLGALTKIGNFEIGESEISNPKSEISDRSVKSRLGGRGSDPAEFLVFRYNALLATLSRRSERPCERRTHQVTPWFLEPSSFFQFPSKRLWFRRFSPFRHHC